MLPDEIDLTKERQGTLSLGTLPKNFLKKSSLEFQKLFEKSFYILFSEIS